MRNDIASAGARDRARAHLLALGDGECGERLRSRGWLRCLGPHGLGVHLPIPNDPRRNVFCAEARAGPPHHRADRAFRRGAGGRLWRAEAAGLSAPSGCCRRSSRGSRRTGENPLALADFESGDFLPGRGLLDMKAGLAAGIAAMEAYAGDGQSAVPRRLRRGRPLGRRARRRAAAAARSRASMVSTSSSSSISMRSRTRATARRAASWRWARSASSC